MLLLPLFLLFSSCFGLDLDIALNADGSGTVTLEYRVSQEMDALGRLDGNERWNTIPVGMADFQRTIDRLPDMRLVSFSSRQGARDIIVSARMEFASIQGLMAFLDASGQRSSFAFNPGGSFGSHITLTLSDGVNVTNPELAALLAVISEGYTVSMSMSVPPLSIGNLAVSDSQGRSLTAMPQSGFETTGRRVAFSVPLYEVLTAPEGLLVEFRW